MKRILFTIIMTLAFIFTPIATMAEKSPTGKMYKVKIWYAGQLNVFKVTDLSQLFIVYGDRFPIMQAKNKLWLHVIERYSDGIDADGNKVMVIVLR